MKKYLPILLITLLITPANAWVWLFRDGTINTVFAGSGGSYINILCSFYDSTSNPYLCTSEEVGIISSSYRLDFPTIYDVDDLLQLSSEYIVYSGISGSYLDPNLPYLASVSTSGETSWFQLINYSGLNTLWSYIYFMCLQRDTITFPMLFSETTNYTIIARYDSSGDEIWHTVIYTDNPCAGAHIALTPSNDIGALVWTRDINLFYYLDSSGEVVCSTAYADITPADTVLKLYRIVKSINTGFLIMGIQYSVVIPMKEIALLRIDTTGTILSRRNYTFDRQLFTYPKIIVTPSGCIDFLCEFCDSFPVFIHCDSAGNVLASREIILDSLTLAGYTNVTGFSRCSNGDYLVIGNFDYYLSGDWGDFFIIRIDSLGNDVPGATDIHDNVSLSKELSLFTYPNPFNNTLAINTLPNAKVAIFDLRGNVVFSEQTPNGKVNWCPAEELASGVYLVKVSLNQSVTSKRIVMLK